MYWKSEERAYAVAAYFSNVCSVIATQRAFRNRFNVVPLAPVPDQKSIITWITTFRQTGSATSPRSGDTLPIRSPESIEAVRASVLRSPRCSAPKHAPALGLSYRCEIQEIDDTMPVKKGLKRRVSSVSTQSGSKKAKIIVSCPEVTHLKDAGVVLTFGQGDVGQLGLGEDIMERMRPALVPEVENIVDVCAGGMHTICLSKKGEVFSFGCNDEGGLGRETTVEGSEFKPGKVALQGKAVQITAGDSHSAVLLEDGRVFAWGSFRDSIGAMGLTMCGIEKKPVEILPGIVVVKIASGSDHLVMLSNEGLLYTCGCGEQGQLGRVTERGANRRARQGLSHLLKPEQVKLKPRLKSIFDDIWAGSYCTFAKEIKTGSVYVFGLNNHNQLGVKNSNEQNMYFQPVISPSLSEKSISKVCVGQHHTIILDKEGKVYALGRKEYGRLGLGKDCSDVDTPTLITALENKVCVDIACGTSVSFAVTSNGEAFGWGMGTSGQLGSGEEDDLYEPCLIQGKQLESRKAVRVSAGGQHTVLLAVDN